MTEATGTMEAFWRSSVFEASNAAYIEELYEQYLEAPHSVPEAWRAVFDALRSEATTITPQERPHRPVIEQFKQLVRKPISVASGTTAPEADKQTQVFQLITAFRLRGHHAAQINPLAALFPPPMHSDLNLAAYHLNAADLRKEFDTETFVGPKKQSLEALVTGLKEAYCSTLGVEFMHLSSKEERRWIQQRVENTRGKPTYSTALKRMLLDKLTAAEGLERYLGSKFPGAKRFSLEGTDVLIPMLHELVTRSGSMGTKEVVLGMAHRGRLNVLVNILGKKPLDLFDEFEGKHDDGLPSGDVKYHQGFSSDQQTEGGPVHVTLAFNPSHLEIVTPVVQGSVRARQSRRSDADRDQVFCIAIHGDAAFAGQGVVMETLNMSQTRGYGIGGTVHIVVNNQVGFTTSAKEDARSTEYCTDVAKMIESPVLHVNADDPEMCLYAVQLALDFRMTFKKDVVIDLVGYRRFGHNEADEPAATQPLMYQFIRKHPTVRQLYAEKLIKEGVLTAKEADDIVKVNRDKLDHGAAVVDTLVDIGDTPFTPKWHLYMGKRWTEKATTYVAKKELEALGKHIATVPSGFALQPRVAKIMEDRNQMATGQIPMDWGFAENLAYASLLKEGYPVRITGQDCGRGTFFHRHAVLHNHETGERFIPLQTVPGSPATFSIHDSLLSEEAVMGFEYGYATTDPKTLVIWEAQFGDFANGAQVVIDQFISSGEQKWGRLCGLTLLLPHGYEGQGPEHSSARPERFLQLCAEENIQVCFPSTPAQIFHLLRRQMVRPVRKPLVIMSPKSLLRHRLATSTLSELTAGEFSLVIPEKETLNPKVRKVILCCGKVYYDLVEYREKLAIRDVALVRIEQLYPFPTDALKEVLRAYSDVKEIVWCQDEPQNQGAWMAIQPWILAVLKSQQTLQYCGRPAAAAPAVGHLQMHQEQQQALLEATFA